MAHVNIRPIGQQVIESIPQHMGRTDVIEEIGVDESGHQWRRYHTQFILDDQYKTLATAQYERKDAPATDVEEEVDDV